jgi:hypothetical protein
MNKDEFIDLIINESNEILISDKNVINYQIKRNEENQKTFVKIYVQYTNRYDHIVYTISIEDSVSSEYSIMDLKGIKIFDDLVENYRNSQIDDILEN